MAPCLSVPPGAPAACGRPAVGWRPASRRAPGGRRGRRAPAPDGAREPVCAGDTLLPGVGGLQPGRAAGLCPLLPAPAIGCGVKHGEFGSRSPALPRTAHPRRHRRQQLSRGAGEAVGVVGRVRPGPPPGRQAGHLARHAQRRGVGQRGGHDVGRQCRFGSPAQPGALPPCMRMWRRSDGWPSWWALLRIAKCSCSANAGAMVIR